jgi:uncharacterized protein (DUF1330 family)
MISYKLGLTGIAGAMIGAAVMQGLHAQARPPAYLVLEIDVKDANLFKQYQDKGSPLYPQFTGRFLVRGGKVEAFAAEPPKRVVIAEFDSIEKAQAFRDSPAYKELVPLRDRGADVHGYIAEGVEN